VKNYVKYEGNEKLRVNLKKKEEDKNSISVRFNGENVKGYKLMCKVLDESKVLIYG
jgi:hypothetical protein